MTVKDLIDRLNRFPLDAEVMIRDSFNGAGVPRTLNLGPCSASITQEDGDESADCEGLEGSTVVTIGFGCY